MRAAWATDIHLRFCDEDERRDFYRQLADAEFDVLFLTGDIGGESDNDGAPEPLDHTDTVAVLKELEENLSRPLYFVLGNHDYYRSSIDTVRRRVAEFCRHSNRLHCLQEQGVVRLTDRTAIIGHECWGDAGWGDFESSAVVLSDWKVIWELKQYWTHLEDYTVDLMPWKLTKGHLDQCALKQHLESLGREAAEHLRRTLPEALALCENVIVLSHVPPFLKDFPGKWRPRPEDYLPGAVCRAAGEVLLEFAEKFPDRCLRVLAGHVHHSQTFQVGTNIIVSTGAAEYMAPRIESIFEIA